MPCFASNTFLSTKTMALNQCHLYSSPGGPNNSAKNNSKNQSYTLEDVLIVHHHQQQQHCHHHVHPTQQNHLQIHQRTSLRQNQLHQLLYQRLHCHQITLQMVFNKVGAVAAAAVAQ